MTVDRIGHVEPISPNKRTGRSERAGGSEKTDTINLSMEAMEQTERYQVIELIKSTPDLDEARIVELRQKLDDPSYLNDKVIKATADNILSAWFA
ncbi:MAG: flagellar biosynthesis anti-sigma factor FlgM [Treponema sp.]|jgi:negative regulator of flagellin synthesis FlgM|nr:flagellar biosynthesis anti-sigma factor FlgM [Treponema sp.]